MTERYSGTAVCILGMHRSGTSVVTRALNLLGAYLGEPQDLLPPSPDNRDGVWERSDIVDFHNRLLAQFSQTWHSVGPLPPGWHQIESIGPYKAELRDLVTKAFSHRPLWAWKDPRTAVLLPLWKVVLSELGIPSSCVYVVRNPLDVAKSLKKRDGFPYEKSFGMWFRATVDAIQNIQDTANAVVSYDSLLSNWEPELRRCTATLGITWPQRDSELRDEMSALIRPDLRHNKSLSADLEAAGVPRQIIQLYEIVENTAAGPGKVTGAEVQAVHSTLRGEFGEISSYFRYDMDRLFLLERHAVESEQRIADLRGAAARLESELGQIKNSVGWTVLKQGGRLADFLLPRKSVRRRVYDALYRTVRTAVNEGVAVAVRRVQEQWFRSYRPYDLWIRKNEPTKSDLQGLRMQSAGWEYRPRVSIVTPVFNPHRRHLVECIQSVLDQVYDNWELCLVNGGSSERFVGEVLEDFAKRDSRIKVVSLPSNRGIAANSNEALRLATGEYVGFLDHDDTLAPFALHEVIRHLNEDPQVDFIYSDEDKIRDRSSQRYDPHFKPEWSPDTELSYNYMCHFAVARRQLVEALGGFREGYDGAQDYDLILRIIERTTRIRRIPKILYHWRAAPGSTALAPAQKEYAAVAAKKAIGDHLRNRGLEAKVLDGDLPTTYRVKYRVKGLPRVSVIIPTRDKASLLKRAVQSLVEKTDYPNFEVMIIDNQSTEDETHEFYRSLRTRSNARVLKYDAQFNFSAINNFAARSSQAEYLLFLNNDTEVISPGWMSAMLEYAQRPDVGAVGARLYYPDGSIQHAGTILGIQGVAGHSHRGFAPGSIGYMGRIRIVQNLSAVTAACMMVRRNVFEEVGGFDEGLAYAFNDVDLCLKIRGKGYLIVYTPCAELYHYESATRGSDETPERRERFGKEVAIMKNRWKHVLEAGDPYYNPNFTLQRGDFRFEV